MYAAASHWGATLFVIVLATTSCADDGPASAPRPIPIESVTAAEPEPTVTTDQLRGPPPSVEPPQPTPAAISDLVFGLELVVTADQPIALAVRSGDRGLYIAEKTGRVRRWVDGVTDPEPYLDLSGRVSTSGERGLLGITFSPDGGRLVASYTDTDGTSVIASWPAGDPIDRDDERIHLTLEQPFANHNGGHIAYGPDGHLYIGFGDGGSGGDPLGSGQDTTTLLGAILRVDLTAEGSTAAPGNPLAEPHRPELWLWGLRNPWRFAFDSVTGDLWIGDVGQGSLEEINVVSPTPSSHNLGWNRYEGTARFSGDVLEDHLVPIVEYGHGTGASVTGGYVYRGTAQPQLDGVYFYGDFSGGWIRGLRFDGNVVTEHTEVLRDVGSIVAFGEDLDGGLYVLTLEGPVYRITTD